MKEGLELFYHGKELGREGEEVVEELELHGKQELVERKEGAKCTGRRNLSRGKKERGLGSFTLCNVMGIALGGPSYFDYLALRNCDYKVNFITLSFNEPNMIM